MRNFQVKCIRPNKLDDTFGVEEESVLSSKFQVIKTWNPDFREPRNIIKAHTKPKVIGRANFESKIQELIFPDRGIFWALCAIPTVIKIAKRQSEKSIIATTSPMFSAHIIGFFLQKFYGAFWIVDVRDFHFLYHREQSFLLTRWLHSNLEKFVLKKADWCTFVSENMLQAYRRLYDLSEDKSQTMYHGLRPRTGISTQGATSGKIKIVYCGSFYQGIRSPWTFLKLLQKLSRDGFDLNSIEILIIGPSDKFLVDELDESVKSRIQWMGPLSNRAAQKVMESCHWGWLTIPDVDAHKHTIPVKFYDYLQAGLSLLAFVPEDAEVATIMQNYRLGLLMNEKMLEDLTDANVKFLAALLAPSKYRVTDEDYARMIDKFGLEKQHEEFLRICEAV